MYCDYIWHMLMNLSCVKTDDSPFAAIAPSKKPFDTVSRGQLVSRGLMGGGGCSSCASGSTSGTYKTQDPLLVYGNYVFIHKHECDFLTETFECTTSVSDCMLHLSMLCVCRYRECFHNAPSPFLGQRFPLVPQLLRPAREWPQSGKPETLET